MNGFFLASCANSMHETVCMVWPYIYFISCHVSQAFLFECCIGLHNKTCVTSTHCGYMLTSRDVLVPLLSHTLFVFLSLSFNV